MASYDQDKTIVTTAGATDGLVSEEVFSPVIPQRPGQRKKILTFVLALFGFLGSGALAFYFQDTILAFVTDQNLGMNIFSREIEKLALFQSQPPSQPQIGIAPSSEPLEQPSEIEQPAETEIEKIDQKEKNPEGDSNHEVQKALSQESSLITSEEPMNDSSHEWIYNKLPKNMMETPKDIDLSKEKKSKWISGIQSEKPWMRYTALKEIEKEPDNSVKELEHFLKGLTKDPKIWIRLEAVVVLEHHGMGPSEGEMGDLLGQSDGILQRYLSRWEKEHSKAQIRLAKKIINNPNISEFIRIRALNILYLGADDEALWYLLLASQKDPDRSVRRFAFHILKRYKKKHIETAQKFLRDKNLLTNSP